MATLAYAPGYKNKYFLKYRIAAGYGFSGVVNPAATLTGQTSAWWSRVQKRYGFTLFAGTVTPPPPP